MLCETIQFDPLVDVFANCLSPDVIRSVSLSSWLKDIQQGKQQDIIRQIRVRGDAGYEMKVTQLETACFQFRFRSTKTNDDIVESTGLVYVDLDDQDHYNPEDVYAAWRSVGGKGWGILYRVEGVTKKNISSIVKALVARYGLHNCKNAVKATQQTVLSYDNNLYINDNCKVFHTEDLLQKEVTKKCHLALYKREEKKEQSRKLNDTFSETLHFNNLHEMEFDTQYAFSTEGYEWVNCKWPKRGTPRGKRARTIMAYFGNWIMLNHGHDPSHLANRMNDEFQEPLKQDEVQRILSYLFKKKEEGTLFTIQWNKKRKILFNQHEEITTKQKRSICGKVVSKEIRPEISRKKLLKAIPQMDWTRKVKDIDLMRVSGLSRNTLKKLLLDHMIQKEIQANKDLHSQHEQQSISPSGVGLPQDQGPDADLRLRPTAGGDSDEGRSLQNSDDGDQQEPGEGVHDTRQE